MSVDWWKKLGRTFIQAIRDFSTDNGAQWAAAIAYYSLLSIFPLLLATISIAAYFVNPNWAVEMVTMQLSNYLPVGVKHIEHIIKGILNARGRAGLLSIVALLWSGTHVFSAIYSALNIVYNGNTKSDGLFKETFVKLIMLVGIGGLFIVCPCVTAYHYLSMEDFIRVYFTRR